eukprot:COSAG06_NODE_6350_length_2971_cov_2.726166_3_plen_243_part_00
MNYGHREKWDSRTARSYTKVRGFLPQTAVRSGGGGTEMDPGGELITTQTNAEEQQHNEGCLGCLGCATLCGVRRLCKGDAEDKAEDDEAFGEKLATYELFSAADQRKVGLIELQDFTTFMEGLMVEMVEAQQQRAASDSDKKKLGIAVGAAVQGLYPPDEVWYDAVVAEVQSNGATYTLDWADGDQAHRKLQASSVRPREAQLIGTGGVQQLQHCLADMREINTDLEEDKEEEKEDEGGGSR